MKIFLNYLCYLLFPLISFFVINFIMMTDTDDDTDHIITFFYYNTFFIEGALKKQICKTFRFEF